MLLLRTCTADDGVQLPASFQPFVGSGRHKGDKPKLEAHWFESHEGRRAWTQFCRVACILNQPAIVEVLGLGRLPVQLPLLDAARASGARCQPLKCTWQTEWIGQADSQQLAKLLLREDGTPLKVRKSRGR